MARKPSWSDADLLLRTEAMSARPELREALDWFHETQLGAASRYEVEIPPNTPEYGYFHSLVGLFEMVGVLVRMRVLHEALALEFWNSLEA